MNQSFLLEAWDDGALRAMDRADVPSLEVTGLRPGTRYTLRVYAENSMGRSQPISFIAFTLTDVAERRTAIGIGDQTEDMSPVLGSVIGGISCVVVLIIVGIVLAKCKHRNRRNASKRNGSSTSNKDGSYNSAKFEQEITKVDSPLPRESVAGGSENARVCDLVSTSQDSMLMSRSQDSSTPLIGNAKSGQFQTSSSQFHSSSAQFQGPSSSHCNDPYLPSTHKEAVSYSKLSSQPLEPSAFKDFANAGSKTLSYRQLRNQAPSYPVSYVPVLDYQSHMQNDGSWGGEMPPGSFRDEKGVGGGLNVTRCGAAADLPSVSSSGLMDTRRHSSYLRPPHSMAGTFPRGGSNHGEDLSRDLAHHRFHMPPTEVVQPEPHLRQSHSSKFPQSFSAEQSLDSPVSMASQQESSV